MKLKDKVAIVTGGAKGLGREISLTLADAGAHLVLAARDTEALETVAQEVRGRGQRAEVVGTDVTKPDQVEAMVERALAVFGGSIDILVLPGAVEGPRMQMLCLRKAELWGKTYEEVHRTYEEPQVLKRTTDAQDTANAVLFLVSEEARNITGQDISVDAGWKI